MAITTTISQKELERQVALCFEGETLNVMLCNVGTTGYDAQSSVANWQSTEVDSGGYVRFSTTIGTGSYDAVTGTYKLPDIDASFTATVPYSYDRVVLYLDGATYPHSILAESPNVTVAPGQTQTYRLSLRQDD